ncbi:MAG: glycosyltransferase family 2 protein [Erysipelotrichaceae bacterium]|nr:glycosyltransferase family 2 protein [Erysipelotrichaceae bacterium]
MEPLFSIIIPFYNPGDTINNAIRCLESIDCSNENIEIIFVDDGTNPDDPSLKIVNDYLLKNYFCRCVHKENGGLGDARNYGAIHAKGKWLIFLDCDDYLQPETIDVFKHIMNLESFDVLMFGFREVDLNSLSVKSELNYKYHVLSNSQINNAFLKRSIVSLLPGTIFKKEFLINNDIWEPKIKWSEDQYFMWEVFNKAERVVVSSYVNYNYLQNVAGSIMNSTSVEEMLKSYIEFESLSSKMNNIKIADLLVPRWALGCCHVLSARSDYESFVLFLNKTHYKIWIKKLLKFPSLKVRVLAFIGLISKRIFFKIMG